MPITAAAGDAFAHKFAKQFAAGFAGNNHAVTMEGLLAPKLSWDWSDATVGEGAPADIMDIFSKSWGMMVDNLNRPDCRCRHDQFQGRHRGQSHH